MSMNWPTNKLSKKMTQDKIDRVIEMAWEDRTPFDAIEFQFGLKENDVRFKSKNQRANN